MNPDQIVGLGLVVSMSVVFVLAGLCTHEGQVALRIFREGMFDALAKIFIGQAYRRPLSPEASLLLNEKQFDQEADLLRTAVHGSTAEVIDRIEAELNRIEWQRQTGKVAPKPGPEAQVAAIRELWSEENWLDFSTKALHQIRDKHLEILDSPRRAWRPPTDADPMPSRRRA